MATTFFVYTHFSNGELRATPRGLVAVGTEQSAREHVDYYKRECGYSDAYATKQDHCDTCGGRGEVPKKRAYAFKTCPTCKGAESPPEQRLA
jgi:DnaJ-class molecular chaperone